MPRPRSTIPAFKFHKQTRQFYAWYNGKRHYLGRDKIAAENRYRLFLQELGQTPAVADVPPDPASLTVAEALDLFVEQEIARYKDRRTVQRFFACIEAACEQHAAVPVKLFSGRALREVRAALVKRKSRKSGKLLTRRYVNHLIDSLLIIFRWLTANEYVPASNLEAMRAQAADLAEHGGGRESEPIPAVDDAVVDATLPKCDPVVRAMVEFQRATGLRPGEVVEMRRGEISTRPDEPVTVAKLGKEVAAFHVGKKLIWLYSPARHKNLHRGKPRAVPIGPVGQAILKPLLAGLGEGDHVFMNGDAPFSVNTYDKAVAEAVEASGAAKWTPNQLRKAAGQEADDKFGADAAGARLGHSASRRALDFYVQEQIDKAAKIASKIG